MRVNGKGEKNGEPDALKGLVAGLLGGLVASAVMNEFQGLWSQLTDGEKRSHGAQSRQTGPPRSGIGRELRASGKDDPEDTAPMRLANAVSVGLADRELTPSEKEASGTALHYAFGASMGALYGVGAEFVPMITGGMGVPYGITVWLGADEGVVPALGLSKSPKEYPLSVHAYALASHAVYGLTTELVRRAIRKAF
jgi:putative membrane protein